MALQIYNTKARQKQPFVPLQDNRVTMYVCGPTVYNFVHIGNARPAVVFDTLFRLLQSEYDEVVYARNITDIDDKIMNTAKENGEDIATLSARYTEAYAEDMANLGCLQPSIIPFATDHIPEMIAMIEQLISKGHAYESQGHALFAVQSMKDYGALSNRSLEDMLDGARVEVADYKRYAGDFVLWKPSSDDEPGWDSPWGRGRPGWHLECSVMIEKHLGETIDIHGGGRDLIFPHHENELAQSCCAHDGRDYVRNWMHNGFLNIDGEKMSKSLGNFRTVRELLGLYKGEVIRFALLSAHYRSEQDFSKGLLDQSKSGLDTLYGALREAGDVQADLSVDIKDQPFYLALLDDLNTAIAVSELHQLAKSLNKASAEDKPKLKGLLLKCAAQIGILEDDPETWFTTTVDSEDEGLAAEEIDALIIERADSKKNKNFARADEIRDLLTADGVVLEDSKDGTKWRRE